MTASKKRNTAERKQAEKALRESEERFRALIEHSHDAIALFGADGAVLYASPSTTRILGYLPEELRQRNMMEFVHPDWQEAVRERLAEALRRPGVGIPSEGYVRHKNGQWRFLEGVFTNLLHEPSVGAIVNNYRDITERKYAEEAHTELSRLLEESLNEIYVFDADTLHFDQVNYGARHNLGYTIDELRALTPLDLKPKFNAQTFGELLRPLRTGEKSKIVFLTKHRRKDNSLYDVEVHLQMGKFEGRSVFVAIILDITERKQAERSLRRLSRRLLEVENEERRRIAKELHDSTAQDLVAVMMNLGMLQGSIAKRDKKAEEILADSLALVENCASEVRTLSYVLHPPRLDETGLAGGLREYASGFSKRAGISVTVDAPAKFGRLPEEIELALFRVAQQSLGNVLRHSHSDTAAITIRTSPDEIALEVADKGRGLPPEIANCEVPVRGVGVGIAGMRERLQQLGGRLELDSSKSGTTVRAILPLNKSNE